MLDFVTEAERRASRADQAKKTDQVPKLAMASMLTTVVLATLGGTVFVALIFLAALWYTDFPKLVVGNSITARTLFDLIKLIFAFIAGIGGVAALVVAYRRQRVAEYRSKLDEFSADLAHAADERAEAAHRLAEAKKALDDASDERAKAADERAKLETDRNGTRLLNERFAKAAEQIGSVQAAVRLAGVYAMASLADDWLDERQTCVDVLCGYLRMPAQWSGDDASSQIAHLQEREVRRTIGRIIGQHLRLNDAEPRAWGQLRLDLTGAVLEDLDLSRAQLFGGSLILKGAKIRGSSFLMDDAVISGASIELDHASINVLEFNMARSIWTDSSISMIDFVFTKGAVILSQSKMLGSTAFTISSGKSKQKFDLHLQNCEFGGNAVHISTVEMSGGSISLAGSHLIAGRVTFEECVFDGGTLSFERFRLAAGTLSFDESRFGGALLNFSRFKFAGGNLKLPPIEQLKNAIFDDLVDITTADGVTFEA